MAEFSIRIFEFALIVHRPVGTTVLSPASGHSLSLDIGDGVKRPVAPGASIFLADAQGVPLADEPTTLTNANDFVFDLQDVVDYSIRVPVNTLVGTTVDPALLNARITLAGGVLTELACSFDPRATWTFENGMTRLVTDQAVHTRSIAADETLLLVVNDEAFEIKADAKITFANDDQVGGPFGEFVHVAEFEALCELARVTGVTPPKTLVDRRQRQVTKAGAFKVFDRAVMLGSDAVCAVARIRSDV